MWLGTCHPPFPLTWTFSSWSKMAQPFLVKGIQTTVPLPPLPQQKLQANLILCIASRLVMFFSGQGPGHSPHVLSFCPEKLTTLSESSRNATCGFRCWLKQAPQIGVWGWARVGMRSALCKITHQCRRFMNNMLFNKIWTVWELLGSHTAETVCVFFYPQCLFMTKIKAVRTQGAAIILSLSFF